MNTTCLQVQGESLQYDESSDAVRPFGLLDAWSDHRLRRGLTFSISLRQNSSIGLYILGIVEEWRMMSLKETAVEMGT